ncbi:MAG: MjaI family restriction endonuclease [Thermoplasmata archaeon]
MASGEDSGVYRLPLSEVAGLVAGNPPVFPKYATQIMNLANQTAQGTRPKVVGQMSELVQACSERTYEGWVKWYETEHPTAISDATEKIWAQVQRYQATAQLIDKEMVQEWVRDLVLKKTFVGLKTQDAVLEVLSKRLKLGPVRRANPSEEAQGIDGFFGSTPVSVKPETYRSQILPEKIAAPIVYYDKNDNSLVIDARELIKVLRVGPGRPHPAAR